jgi:diacylglycerol kinase
MNQEHLPSFSLKKRISSFKYAINGLKTVLVTQANFMIHLIAAVIVTAAGLFFQISIWEWSILVLTITMVLALEVFNTAIEKLIDLVSPDYNILAGKIKDIAAGAVLIASLGAAIIGFAIFLPKILCLF